ncbi:MAG: hypothetical protein HRT99_01020 [Mycoplasmatales bacterium]|nr:hypothetical protein [Mycoplasmatales bacterium]
MKKIIKLGILFLVVPATLGTTIGLYVQNMDNSPSSKESNFELKTQNLSGGKTLDEKIASIAEVKEEDKKELTDQVLTSFGINLAANDLKNDATDSLTYYHEKFDSNNTYKMTIVLTTLNGEILKKEINIKVTYIDNFREKTKNLNGQITLSVPTPSISEVLESSNQELTDQVLSSFGISSTINELKNDATDTLSYYHSKIDTAGSSNVTFKLTSASGVVETEEIAITVSRTNFLSKTESLDGTKVLDTSTPSVNEVLKTSNQALTDQVLSSFGINLTANELKNDATDTLTYYHEKFDTPKEYKMTLVLTKTNGDIIEKEININVTNSNFLSKTKNLSGQYILKSPSLSIAEVKEADNQALTDQVLTSFGINSTANELKNDATDTLTYYHEKFDSVKMYTMTLKLTALDGKVETRVINVNVTKSNFSIKTESLQANKTLRTFEKTVAEVKETDNQALTDQVLASFGINLTANELKNDASDTLSYYHETLNMAKKYTLTLKLTSVSGEDEMKVLDLNVQNSNLINSVNGLSGTYTSNTSKIDEVTEASETVLTDAILAKYNINTTVNSIKDNSNDKVTYFNNELTDDGNLSFTIKVVHPDGTVEKDTVPVAVTGIQDVAMQEAVAALPSSLVFEGSSTQRSLMSGAKEAMTSDYLKNTYSSATPSLTLDPRIAFSHQLKNDLLKDGDTSTEEISLVWKNNSAKTATKNISISTSNINKFYKLQFNLTFVDHENSYNSIKNIRFLFELADGSTVEVSADSSANLTYNSLDYYINQTTHITASTDADIKKKLSNLRGIHTDTSFILLGYININQKISGQSIKAFLGIKTTDRINYPVSTANMKIWQGGNILMNNQNISAPPMVVDQVTYDFSDINLENIVVDPLAKIE